MSAAEETDSLELLYSSSTFDQESPVTDIQPFMYEPETSESEVHNSDNQSDTEEACGIERLNNTNW